MFKHLSLTLFLNQKSSFVFILCLFGVLLSYCSGGGGSSSGSKTAMCYQITYDGVSDNLVLNCDSSDSKCSGDGQQTLATYKNWDTCWNDTDTVLSNWQVNGGTPSPGPNSIEAGGGGGGGLNCEVNDVWLAGSPELNVQAVTMCQGACAYGGSSTSEGSVYCFQLDGMVEPSTASAVCSVC